MRSKRERVLDRSADRRRLICTDEVDVIACFFVCIYLEGTMCPSQKRKHTVSNGKSKIDSGFRDKKVVKKFLFVAHHGEQRETRYNIVVYTGFTQIATALNRL